MLAVPRAAAKIVCVWTAVLIAGVVDHEHLLCATHNHWSRLPAVFTEFWNMRAVAIVVRSQKRKFWFSNHHVL